MYYSKIGVKEAIVASDSVVYFYIRFYFCLL